MLRSCEDAINWSLPLPTYLVDAPMMLFENLLWELNGRLFENLLWELNGRLFENLLWELNGRPQGATLLYSACFARTGVV